MAASPDGLVLDCSETDDPCGLLEIKCPARGEKISLVDLCTKPEHKPSAFFLRYVDGKFYLKLLINTVIRSRVSCTLPADHGVISLFGL